MTFGAQDVAFSRLCAKWQQRSGLEINWLCTGLTILLPSVKIQC